jgi:plasmid maintenance system antidote protein VapI
MAIRFEKAFGVKADTLLRMQTTYELAQAREHEGEIKVGKFAKAA